MTRQLRHRIASIAVPALFALAAPMFTPEALADPVTIASTRVEFGILQEEFPANLQFFVEYPTFGPGVLLPGPRVLETVFTPDAIPRTVRATAESDADFRPFVSFLTNDRPDRIEFTYVTPTPRFGQSFAFVPNDTDIFRVDWRRFTVTSLSYTLNEFSFDRSRPFEIPGAVLFPVVVRGVFEVEGTPSPTPEPSSLILIALGAAGLTGRKLRARGAPSDSCSA